MKASITLDDYARHGIEYMEIGCDKCGRNGRYANRAAAAGLTPPMISGILGTVLTSAHRALDDSRPGALAIVTAWEIMTGEQRRQWLIGLGVQMVRTRRGRPAKAA